MMALATLYFPAGIAIGIGAAAPVGPVNLLVIQRTLAHHRRSALLMGLAAAIGDAAFAVVAAFGLGAIGALVAEHQAAMRIIGGLVMLVFAVIVWRAAPHLSQAAAPSPAGRMALLIFSMTITNPATLLFFLGSISAIGFLGIGHDTVQHRLHAGLLVAGVLLGSMIWWLVVTQIAVRLRGRVSDRHLRLLNQLTAAALGLFGIGAATAGALGV